MSSIKISDAIKIFNLLRELNGFQQIFEEGDSKKLVVTPYNFTGTAVIDIAENINALRTVVANYNTAREMLAEDQDYEKNLTEILNRPVEVSLTVIAASTLRLDRNRVQPGIIADLIHYGVVAKEKS